MIVGSPRGYYTFSRVPRTDQFLAGKIFDSKGNVHEYSGMSSWLHAPRGYLKIMLESTILIPIAFYFISYFVYAGPRITSSSAQPQDLFVEGILNCLAEHEKPKDLAILKRLLDELGPSPNYREIVRTVQGWIAGASLALADPADLV